jgi:formylglycine-generating enzyme required for sulfatase activity
MGYDGAEDVGIKPKILTDLPILIACFCTKMPDQVVFKPHYTTIQYALEDLDGVQLKIVQIPGGEFWMGQTEAEKALLLQAVGEKDYQKSYARELPRHRVRVRPFFLGQYPVTQAQWRTVAGMDKVSLSLDPDPSELKGDQRPVEQVSWYEAVEFCQRLVAKTGRPYRLPSEAEWEYACRAGTETLYHFGDVISTDGFNYAGDYTFAYIYSLGQYTLSQNKEIHSTTKVGQFGCANDFGLFDMHGNVWEWCADHSHDSYNNAPNNGSIWISSDKVKPRIMRGGSWVFRPRDCRSAARALNEPGSRNEYCGFRVACAPA